MLMLITISALIGLTTRTTSTLREAFEHVLYLPHLCRRVTIIALGATTAGALLGCAARIPNQGLNEVTHYFGYVKIEKPKFEREKISAEKVFFLGAKVLDGVQIGVSTSRTLSIPLECRTVIIVANSDQLQEAVSTISRLRLDKVCASEF